MAEMTADLDRQLFTAACRARPPYGHSSSHSLQRIADAAVWVGVRCRVRGAHALPRLAVLSQFQFSVGIASLIINALRLSLNTRSEG